MPDADAHCAPASNCVYVLARAIPKACDCSALQPESFLPRAHVHARRYGHVAAVFGPAIVRHRYGRPDRAVTQPPNPASSDRRRLRDGKSRRSREQPNIGPGIRQDESRQGPRESRAGPGEKKHSVARVPIAIGPTRVPRVEWDLPPRRRLHPGPRLASRRSPATAAPDQPPIVRRRLRGFPPGPPGPARNQPARA